MKRLIPIIACLLVAGPALAQRGLRPGTLTDGLLCTYVDATRDIDCTTAAGAFTSFDIDGDNNAPQEILNGNEALFVGGSGIATVAAVTDQVTFNLATDEAGSIATGSIPPANNEALVIDTDGDGSLFDTAVLAYQSGGADFFLFGVQEYPTDTDGLVLAYNAALAGAVYSAVDDPPHTVLLFESDAGPVISAGGAGVG